MGPSLPSVLDPPPDPSRPPDSPEPLALPALHLDLAPPGHLGSAPPGSLGPDLPGSLEPLAVQALALETLGLRCQASPPPWSPSCSLRSLLQWLRPWLALGGAPAFLLEAPTGRQRHQSMKTVLPSTTLSTRSPTTSSRTTSPARSPGTVTL